MPDEVKIPVRTPGAAQAKRELSGVAAAEQKVGQAGRRAGQEAKKGSDQATKGTRESKEAVDELGRSVGLNVRAFASWKLAGVAAVAAIAAGAKKLFDNMKAIHAEIRATYEEFVDLEQQAETIQLAQIREEPEAVTTKRLIEQSKKFDLRPEVIREASFELESGIAPKAVGGRGALKEIEEAAFMTARAGGATGGAVAGLAIAGFEAGLARTPEEFRQLFAKATAYAGKSRVSLQDLSVILTRLLPLAVDYGIDPDYFMAMAAAMSFRIRDPSRLATNLERLIRAAGVKGPAVEEYAARMGQDLSRMGAVDIWKLHSGLITAAARRGGPQAATAMAEELGLSGEMAMTYGAAFNPDVQKRLGGMMAIGARAGWQPTIAARFEQLTKTPGARFRGARTDLRLQKYRRAESLAGLLTGEKEAEATVAAWTAEGRPEATRAEAVGLSGVQSRRFQIDKLMYELENIAHIGGYPPEIKARAAAALDALKGNLGGPLHKMTGIGMRSEMQAGAAVAQEAHEWQAERISGAGRATVIINHNEGQTHYNKPYKDPAGRIVDRGGGP